MDPTVTKSMTYHINETYMTLHVENVHSNLTFNRIPEKLESLVILRIVAPVILCFNLLVVMLFGVLLYRFRTRKIIKAGSPLLLNVTLLGAILQYICCFVDMTSHHNPVITCIISQWLQLTGFTLMYGALGLKTWRVSVILLFYKSRQMYTKDQALVIRLLALLGTVLLYLLIWTVISLHKSYVNTLLCSLTTWGQFATYFGKLILLLWGCVMCYQARFAPTIYNDSTYLGLAMWNHVVWLANVFLSRYYLETYHSDFWNFLISFLYTECTVSITLILVFIPKFSSVLSRNRIIEGTLTDVYGPSRVHKLTLVINKTGSVRTISCSPCGPLQDVGDSTQHTETSDIRETKETEYSKEEVNALIELVSKLKSERQYYKTQLKTFISDLRNLKTSSGVNGLKWPETPYVPPTPCLPESREGDNKEEYSHNKCFPNGFSPNSYWVANFLNSPDMTANKALLGNQQCSTAKNVIGRSKTGDSINTIITTVSMSPSINMAETNLGINKNKDVNQSTNTSNAAIKSEANNNSSLDTFGGNDIWARHNYTGYDNNGQSPLSSSNQGSNMCCINQLETLNTTSCKSKIPQRPNTLTIASRNQQNSSNNYTKRTHYVFYI